MKIIKSRDYRAFIKLWAKAAGSRWKLSEIREVCAEQCAQLILMKDGKEVIGCAIVYDKLNKDGDLYFYIGFVAIDPDYQGRGLGKQLLLKIMENSRDTFELEVDQANLRAQRLYESVDFVHQGNSLLRPHMKIYRRTGI